jgi:glycerol kinase
LTEERICATDESIAGRTLFFNIIERSWEEDLLRLFKIREQILPEIRPTCQLYGHYPFKNRSIPITCSIGDHQAALIGLGGLEKDHCGLNYGTSAGVLMNIGKKANVTDGLLTNILYSTKEEVSYTAEGTVNAVGSLFEWFEKEKGISGAAQNWETQVAPSSEGWMMIPGMYGIAAPYWKENVPAEFKGQGDNPSLGILLRAGMESIAYLVADILDQLKKIPGLRIDQITAGGGAARRPLLQFQSDLLGLPIRHSAILDATALGCAFLTGLQAGFWKDKREIQETIQIDAIFYPRLASAKRHSYLSQWHNLLKARGILP